MLTAGVLLAACGGSPGPSGPRTVFPVLTGFKITGPTRVGEINDVGLPGLKNISAQTVRLRSVTIVDALPSLRIRDVQAYNSKQVGYNVIIGQRGDLHAECPGQFIPHRIGSFVVPAHKLAAYFVVLAFTFDRPGIYHLRRVKILYTSAGKTFWQYQNIDSTFIVTNPPLPGLRPLPKSAVCGHP